VLHTLFVRYAVAVNRAKSSQYYTL